MSACGVLCSECPAFLGSAKGSEHQRRTVEAWHRIYSRDETAEHISCSGCLGPDEEVFYTSRNCSPRHCCQSKGLASCAECPIESCTDLESAQSVWDGVPSLIDKISSSDFATYAQPYCDHRKRLAAARAVFFNQQ
jgi:hypothetical protein